MTANDGNIDPNERQERQTLESVKKSLRAALHAIDTRVSHYVQDVQQQKDYSWDHRADMDHVEKIATRQSIAQAVFTAEAAVATKQRLQKLLASPYFGRFDFVAQGRSGALSVYVGIHGFHDEVRKANLV